MKSFALIIILLSADCFGQLPPEFYFLGRGVAASAGGDPEYTPDTNGLVARYRAASSGLTSNGQQTNRWFDSVGVNHLNSYYAPSAYLPFFTNVAAINSKGAFQFGASGYEQMWTNTSTTIAQPVTIYAVCQFKGGSGSDQVLVGSSGAGAYVKPVNLGGWAVYGGTQISGGSWTTGSWYIVEARIDGASSYLMTNNVLSIATNNAGTTGLKLVSIGNNYANVAAFNGGIAEVLVYNNRPDATARTAISNYFRQYYNLP